MRIFLTSVVALGICCSTVAVSQNQNEERYNPLERMKNEYRLYQAGGTKGSLELWIPRSELPQETLWVDLTAPPPLSTEEAIQAAPNEGERMEEFSGITLWKQFPPKNLAPAHFWQYTVTFGLPESFTTYVMLMDGRIWKVEEFHPWP